MACLRTTRHVFVKHGCPQLQQSPNIAKISKSYILTPSAPPPGAWDVSEVWGTNRWITVKVWLLYHHLNFKYCTLDNTEMIKSFDSKNIETLKFIASRSLVTPNNANWNPVPFEHFKNTTAFNMNTCTRSSKISQRFFPFSTFWRRSQSPFIIESCVYPRHSCIV